VKRQPLSGDTGSTFDSETEDVTTSDLDNGKPKHRCSHELGKCYGLKATRHPGAGIGSSRAAVVSLNACWRPSVLANDGTPKPVPTSSSSLAASSAPRNVSTVAKHGLTWQAQAGSYFTGDSHRTLACRYAHSEGQKADPRETPWCSPTRRAMIVQRECCVRTEDCFCLAGLRACGQDLLGRHHGAQRD